MGFAMSNEADIRNCKIHINLSGSKLYEYQRGGKGKLDIFPESETAIKHELVIHQLPFHLTLH